MSNAKSIRNGSNDSDSKITGIDLNPRKFANSYKRVYKYKNVTILIYTASILDVKVEAITNSLDESINFQGSGLAALILKKYGIEIEKESKKIASRMGKIVKGMVISLCFQFIYLI